MQSSPFHTNKIFDGKFSMLNVPKTTKNSSWRLVKKDVDEKTGSFCYSKLVNNEVDTKVVETKNELMKETQVNTATFENQETVVEKEEVVEEKETIVPEKSIIQDTARSSVIEIHIENNCILTFDFETFTAKTRNVIMSPFSNECIKVNSKDFKKLSENSRFLDYKKDFLTKINHVIFLLKELARILLVI